MSSFTVSNTPSLRKVPEFERLNALLAQREVLEIEADAIGSELTSPGPNGEPPAGLKDSLVDKEGYPRGDIDIFRVRTQRHRLAEINTDYKDLMKDITEETKKVHALKMQEDARNGTSNRSSASTSSGDSTSAAELLHLQQGGGNNDPQQGQGIVSYESLTGIATVDQILDHSPACEAGLLDGDVLLAFGPVNCDSCSTASASASASASDTAMNMVPGVVRANVNKAVKLVVRRRRMAATTAASSIVVLTLTPRVWDGRGLLGCHLSKMG
jgi:26S proteasome non-ATPase regulatory subunit 9